MKRTKWPKKKKKLRAKTKRQRVTKKHHQLIAVNLKKKMKHFEQHPPNIPGFSVSRMKYLIHLILTRKQDKHQGAYAVLNMHYMNNVIPQASQYLHFLKSEGIIEWINYSAGRNSRLYRLVDEGWTEQVPITDMEIIRRIEKNQKLLSSKNSKKYPWLNQSIRKVELDFKEARQAVENKYQQNILKGMDSQGAEARRTYALSAIIRIQADEIYYKVNSTNGRLDSNFTNLPGYLMKFLTIDGQPLIEMDVTNSQPYFASALFNPTPEVQELMKQYLGASFTMSVKSWKYTEIHDVRRYRSLVSTGRFYEYMAEQFNEHGIEFSDRKDLKRQIFVVFFGKRYAYKWEPSAWLFKQLFPNVHKVFHGIKREHHNRLAIFLQRLESYAMLERVAKEVEKEFPELSMLTKHDSILPVRIVIPNEPAVLDTVRQIMVSTLTDVTGVKPQGRMKRLRTKKIT